MLSTKEPQEQPTHAGGSLETGDNPVRWTLIAPSSDPQQKESSRLPLGLFFAVFCKSPFVGKYLSPPGVVRAFRGP